MLFRFSSLGLILLLDVKKEAKFAREWTHLTIGLCQLYFNKKLNKNWTLLIEILRKNIQGIANKHYVKSTDFQDKFGYESMISGIP